MSQHSGAFTIELDTSRLAAELADAIADRVLSRLREAYRETGGGDVYERVPDPDPGAGPRRGVAGYGDVTDDGVTPA